MGHLARGVARCMDGCYADEVRFHNGCFDVGLPLAISGGRDQLSVADITGQTGTDLCSTDRTRHLDLQDGVPFHQNGRCGVLQPNRLHDDHRERSLGRLDPERTTQPAGWVGLSLP